MKKCFCATLVQCFDAYIYEMVYTKMKAQQMTYFIKYDAKYT